MTESSDSESFAKVMRNRIPRYRQEELGEENVNEVNQNVARQNAAEAEKNNRPPAIPNVPEQGSENGGNTDTPAPASTDTSTDTSTDNTSTDTSTDATTPAKGKGKGGRPAVVDPTGTDRDTAEPPKKKKEEELPEMGELAEDDLRSGRHAASREEAEARKKKGEEVRAEMERYGFGPEAQETAREWEDSLGDGRPNYEKLVPREKMQGWGRALLGFASRRGEGIKDTLDAGTKTLGALRRLTQSFLSPNPMSVPSALASEAMVGFGAMYDLMDKEGERLGIKQGADKELVLETNKGARYYRDRDRAEKVSKYVMQQYNDLLQDAVGPDGDPSQIGFEQWAAVRRQMNQMLDPEIDRIERLVANGHGLSMEDRALVEAYRSLNKRYSDKDADFKRRFRLITEGVTPASITRPRWDELREMYEKDPKKYENQLMIMNILGDRIAQNFKDGNITPDHIRNAQKQLDLMVEQALRTGDPDKKMRVYESYQKRLNYLKAYMTREADRRRAPKATAPAATDGGAAGTDAVPAKGTPTPVPAEPPATVPDAKPVDVTGDAVAAESEPTEGAPVPETAVETEGTPAKDAAAAEETAAPEIIAPEEDATTAEETPAKDTAVITEPGEDTVAAPATPEQRRARAINRWVHRNKDEWGGSTPSKEEYYRDLTPEDVEDLEDILSEEGQKYLYDHTSNDPKTREEVNRKVENARRRLKSHYITNSHTDPEARMKAYEMCKDQNTFMDCEFMAGYHADEMENAFKAGNFKKAQEIFKEGLKTRERAKELHKKGVPLGILNSHIKRLNEVNRKINRFYEQQVRKQEREAGKDVAAETPATATPPARTDAESYKDISDRLGEGLLDENSVAEMDRLLADSELSDEDKGKLVKAKEEIENMGGWKGYNLSMIGKAAFKIDSEKDPEKYGQAVAKYYNPKVLRDFITNAGEMKDKATLEEYLKRYSNFINNEQRPIPFNDDKDLIMFIKSGLIDHIPEFMDVGNLLYDPKRQKRLNAMEIEYYNQTKNPEDPIVSPASLQNPQGHINLLSKPNMKPFAAFLEKMYELNGADLSKSMPKLLEIQKITGTAQALKDQAIAAAEARPATPDPAKKKKKGAGMPPGKEIRFGPGEKVNALKWQQRIIPELVKFEEDPSLVAEHPDYLRSALIGIFNNKDIKPEKRRAAWDSIGRIVKKWKEIKNSSNLPDETKDILQGLENWYVTNAETPATKKIVGM